ncbi:MAG: hypothetical protein AVDCRST_MAG11-4131, partial [uncultured Gemmatimonadaceae bacterium]
CSARRCSRSPPPARSPRPRARRGPLPPQSGP